MISHELTLLPIQLTHHKICRSGTLSHLLNRYFAALIAAALAGSLQLFVRSDFSNL